jgi:hypothetical protein
MKEDCIVRQLKMEALRYRGISIPWSRTPCVLFLCGAQAVGRVHGWIFILTPQLAATPGIHPEVAPTTH